MYCLLGSTATDDGRHPEVCMAKDAMCVSFFRYGESKYCFPSVKYTTSFRKVLNKQSPQRLQRIIFGKHLGLLVSQFQEIRAFHACSPVKMCIPLLCQQLQDQAGHLPALDEFYT